MADFVANYGLFLLKVLTLVIAIIVVVFAVVGIGTRGRKEVAGGHIEIKKLNEQFEHMEDVLSLSLLDPIRQKLLQKEKKAEHKAEKKANKKAAKLAKKQRGSGETIVPNQDKRRLFVLEFDGDLRASQVEKLRQEISAVLTTATSDDEVVVRLESGGGMVTSYGLGASQLDRITQKKIPLTICVDKVAASGGYMMACVADKLLAAPFAVVGSIGVVAQIPNFHRLLQQFNIDFELLTAGKYKRTLTIFGENTDEGRQKFIEDIERIHTQFKQYVGERRPQLDIEAVATGEIWSGQDAVDQQLVDELSTSDEYIMAACSEADVIQITYKERKPLMDRFSLSIQSTIDGLALRWLDRLMKSRFSIG